jgi:hypothetical protein
MYAAQDPKAKACIEAVLSTLEEHGFSLAHEDSQGGFIIETRDDPGNVTTNEEWLRGALMERK